MALWLWLRGFLGSAAEVEENWDVRRGTEWWRWQIAEARRASSITPCGYTMWLSSPEETWYRFHLYETGVFGGIDKHFRCIFYCYPSLKKVHKKNTFYVYLYTGCPKSPSSKIQAAAASSISTELKQMFQIPNNLIYFLIYWSSDWCWCSTICVPISCLTSGKTSHLTEESNFVTDCLQLSI